MNTADKKRFFGNALIVILTTALALLVVEIVLRKTGHGFWREMEPFQRPTLYQPDPDLGWRPMAGIHHAFPSGPQGIEVTFTNRADGSRITRDPAAPEPTGKHIVLIGDSFTEGVAVSDRDTFAWQLQAINPGDNIENYGVAGFNTVQSNRMLMRLIAQKHPIDVVIYGFLYVHEDRNVAGQDWVFALSGFARQSASMPYVRRYSPETSTLEEGDLPVLVFPYRQYSALITRLQALYTSYISTRPGHDAIQSQAREITFALLRKMHKIAAEANSQLMVVLFIANTETQQAYTQALTQDGITVVNCTYNLDEPGMRVAVDGHPSPPMHKRYADCIDAALKKLPPTPH